MLKDSVFFYTAVGFLMCAYLLHSAQRFFFPPEGHFVVFSLSRGLPDHLSDLSVLGVLTSQFPFYISLTICRNIKPPHLKSVLKMPEGPRKDHI